MASDFFYSTLNGQTYSDLYQKVLNLDRSVTSFQDRLKNVNKLLGENSYLKKYFSDYFNSHLTSMNRLSSGNNICHLVEILANYLLMTDEVKAIDGREKTYYIDSNMLNRQRDKPGDIQEKYGKNNTMVVQFNNQNYKYDKKVKIKAKDFDKSWCGRVLSDQQAAIDEATYKSHHHKGNQFKLAHMKHELRQDQLETKISLKGVFDLNSFNADSSSDDYYSTLSEPQTVKAMLKMPHNKAVKKNVTQLLWLDLKDLIKQVKFSNSEYFVLGLYSLGYTYRDIAKRYRHDDGTLYPVSEQYINQILKRLFIRIAQQDYLNNLNSLKKRFHIKTTGPVKF